ncbi:MAG: HEPN domain-containing protein, partial [bacterium]|nr:HEPN domain-containing protein [bacterium]
GKNKLAAEIWLAKAKDDLAFAKAGWQKSKIASVTCILSQQATEKALKALLELENINIEKTPSLKTHRLIDLIEECKKYYPQKIEAFIDDCEKLTVYYFDRYPTEIPLALSEEDATFALNTADEILQFVNEIISRDL